MIDFTQHITNPLSGVAEADAVTKSAAPAPAAAPADSLLDQLELSTGHFQRAEGGPGTDADALAAATGELPACPIDPEAPTPCAFITGRAGTGKCLGRGTPVMLHSGKVIPVEEVKTGDLLMGPDSLPRLVLSTTTGTGPLHKVTPTKGEPFIVNEHHVLVLKMSGKAYRNRYWRYRTACDTDCILEMPVREYLNTTLAIKKDAKAFRVGVDFPAQSVLIDPYFLGLWLGDGGVGDTKICNPDKEIIEYLHSFAQSLGLFISNYTKPPKCPTWSLHVTRGGKGIKRKDHVNPLRSALREISVFNNKHVPDAYKFNSREIRLRVLAGLLDTDGYLSQAQGSYDIISKWEKLADDIMFLARSVGLAAYKKACKKTCQIPGFVGDYYRVSISGDIDMIPCAVLRKQAGKRRQIKEVLMTGIKVESHGTGDYFGFQIDGDGRFLLGDFTVTHNSTLLRERCSSDPQYAVLAASTGIAAVNLGTVTIHSLLGFFDTDSLRDAYIKGQAQRKLAKLADEGFRNVVVDECSMISRDVLDVLVRVFDDVNLRRAEKGDRPVGLLLVGDACQLPAIADRPAGYHSSPTPGRRRAAQPIPWFFDSTFWDRFARNTTHLTKVWRQADQRFLAALDFARSGRGRDCLQVLQSAGQRFESGVDMAFEGTTVVGKNDEVDRINQIRLDREKGRAISLPSRRWAAAGRVRPEWKHIPERTILREGCYVMILANQYASPQSGGGMVYANGDCGWVRGIQVSADKISPPTVMVELVRTGEVVHVSSLVRDISFGDQPAWVSGEWDEQGKDEDGKFWPRPHRRKSKGRWVVGQLEYFPLRLAYASTTHKVQGLSLDRVQVDFRNWMYRQPAMTYVSMSRARTLAGLRLVGTPELLAGRCVTDPKVERWL